MFNQVDRATLKLMAVMSDRMTYAADEILFNQGDVSDSVFIVLSGSFDVINVSSGEEVRLARLEGGTIVGDLGVLGDRPRSATIRSVTEMHVLRIEKDDFLGLIQQVPKLAMAVARELALRLERLNTTFVEKVTT
jgi:CRP/FNR family transcriptional regulator, cyclic AMP receptor protein